jgi:hypothetical protein
VYELKTLTVKAADLRTGDRLPIGTRENSIARIEIFDETTVNVWIEGRTDRRTYRPWLVLEADQAVTVRRPTAPPADEMFDQIERTDAAAARFERDPQNVGSIEPANRIPSRREITAAEALNAIYGTPQERVRYDERDAGPVTYTHESREVGPVAVDEIGPESARSFEISLWDNDEGEFVHAMMLPNREAAEALLRALGKILLG